MYKCFCCGKAKLLIHKAILQHVWEILVAIRSLPPDVYYHQHFTIIYSSMCHRALFIHKPMLTWVSIASRVSFLVTFSLPLITNKIRRESVLFFWPVHMERSPCWHPRRNLHSYLQEEIENFLFLPGVWLYMTSFLCDNYNAPAFL